MRWFLRFFLTVIIIGLLGSLGYLYVNSQTVVVPDIPTIEIETLEKKDLTENRKETLRQLLAEKKTALEYQSNLLENKKDLLNKRRQEIESYINNEAEKIRDRYQSKVDNYQEELERKYREFEESKEQEYLEQMLVKKELYEEKLGELVNNLEEYFFQNLEQHRHDLVKDYYIERINYDLKLNFLDLSHEDEEEYINKLTEMEEEQMISIQAKESEIIQEIENKIDEFKEEYNIELEEFEKQLKNMIERELSNKKSVDNEILEDYLIQQQAVMEKEIEEKNGEIRERTRDEIIALEGLIKDISQESYSLQSEVSILEKEVMY